MNTFDITSEEIRKEKEAMTTKHTPTPWATDILVPMDGRLDKDATIYQNNGSGQGNEICTFRHSPDENLDNRHPQAISDAEFIVRACNAHEELIQALSKVDERLSRIDTRGDYYLQEEIGRAKMQISVALAKARGE